MLPASTVSNSGIPKAVGQTFWDGAGVLTSLLCVIHCVGLPLVLTVFPNLGFAFFQSESFHLVAAILAGAIALSCFQKGYRQHPDRRLMLGGGLGAVLLF